MTNEDCCFTNKDNWFRYRAAAVIIEDNCVLFAKSENEADDYFYSIGGGVHIGEKIGKTIRIIENCFTLWSIMKVL